MNRILNHYPVQFVLQSIVITGKSMMSFSDSEIGINDRENYEFHMEMGDNGFVRTVAQRRSI
jgi:hypothetical protein